MKIQFSELLIINISRDESVLVEEWKALNKSNSIPIDERERKRHQKTSIMKCLPESNSPSQILMSHFDENSGSSEENPILHLVTAV
ncbi:11887_t:CDS:2 [Funneliformis caledonium]|uniref:11887_t:CDS:1 n=1 Tax=Funneliformis caledonium TaxID=1117310 RepID=A0A9N9FTH3_9GLOM|nr:11887_t:CDS:2 [Funneliformis caledonium]